MLKRGPVRWIARALLAVMLFAQASVALADCVADRGHLSRAMVSADMDLCHSTQTRMTDFGPLNPNRCVAHCTSDLQIGAAMMALVRNPADLPVLVLPRAERAPVRLTGLTAPPPGTPPPRIFLHAFLV